LVNWLYQNAFTELFQLYSPVGKSHLYRPNH